MSKLTPEQLNKWIAKGRCEAKLILPSEYQTEERAEEWIKQLLATNDAEIVVTGVAALLEIVRLPCAISRMPAFSTFCDQYGKDISERHTEKPIKQSSAWLKHLEE